jgi:hypothetical protein
MTNNIDTYELTTQTNNVEGMKIGVAQDFNKLILNHLCRILVIMKNMDDRIQDLERAANP